MKKKLFVCCTMAMAAALLMPTMTSCESFHLQDEQQQEQPAGKAHVKLRFVSASQPSSFAKAAVAPMFDATLREPPLLPTAKSSQTCISWTTTRRQASCSKCSIRRTRQPTSPSLT
jgi:hypothetical protein